MLCVRQSPLAQLNSPYIYTRYRMLEDFVALKAGDVVVQNAANSMVGQTVIQLCKLKGVKTINLVRARPDLGATVDYLKSIGGDVVVPEE